MPLAELHPFKGHPFRVIEDEEMMEMVESVKQFGVLVPVIVRHSFHFHPVSPCFLRRKNIQPLNIGIHHSDNRLIIRQLTGRSETDSYCCGGEPFFFEGRGAGTVEGLCGAEAGVPVKGGSGTAAGTVAQGSHSHFLPPWHKGTTILSTHSPSPSTNPKGCKPPPQSPPSFG